MSESGQQPNSEDQEPSVGESPDKSGGEPTVDPSLQEPTDEEVERQFADGFTDISSLENQDSPPEPESVKAVEKGSAAEGALDERDEHLKVLKERVRRSDGRYGELNARMQQITTQLNALIQQQQGQQANPAPTGGGVEPTAPSREELSPDWAEFVEEYPHMAGIVEENQLLKRKMGELESRIGQAGAPQSGVVQQPSGYVDSESLAEKVALDMQYPDWENETKTPEFLNFILDGGPNREVIDQINQVEDQKEKAKASGDTALLEAIEGRLSEMIEDVKFDHSEWFADRGEILLKPGVQNSLELMRRFKEVQSASTSTPSPSGNSTESSAHQISAAYMPRGRTAPAPKPMSDEDAFGQGFQEIAGVSG